MNLLERLGRRLGAAQHRRPWLFLMTALIITLATLPGLPLLITNVEPSIEKVLPQDIEVIKTMNALRSQYGADMAYLVIEADEQAATITDIRHPEVLRYQRLLTERLLERRNILEARSIADAVAEANDGLLPANVIDAREQIERNPQRDLFIDELNRLSIVQIRTDTGANAEIIGRVVESIEDDIAALENENPGLSVRITGFNAIDHATFSIIISDFARITVWSFLAILTVLLIYNRGSIKKTLLSLSVIMLALIWTLGITGYAGITVTVVTMVAAAMIMALGIDYGVHAVHRYFELRTDHDAEQSLQSLQEELVRAFVGSAFTTSAGFLALLAGVLPTMRNLGIILAIGIMITLFTSVTITPALFAVSESRKR